MPHPELRLFCPTIIISGCYQFTLHDRKSETKERLHICNSTLEKGLFKSENILKRGEPKKMKEAIVHEDLSVNIVDSPIPQPEPDQLVIRVVVSGSNPKDW